MMVLLLAFVFVSCDNNNAAVDSGVPVTSFADLKDTTWKTGDDSDYISIYFFVSTGDSTSSNMAEVKEKTSSKNETAKQYEVELDKNDSTLTLTHSGANYTYKATFNEAKTELTLTQTGDQTIIPQHNKTSFTLTKQQN